MFTNFTFFATFQLKKVNNTEYPESTCGVVVKRGVKYSIQKRSVFFVKVTCIDFESILVNSVKESKKLKLRL